MMPQAGEDGKWLKDNMEAFQHKADGGDEEFKDLIEDVTSRGMV